MRTLHAKQLACVIKLALLCLPPAVVNAQALVPAGKMFSNTFLDVRAPVSGDWMIVKSSQTELAFARTGTAVNESFIAQATLFALPELKDKVEFEALVRQGIEAEAPAERFKPVSANYEYTEQRGYPCVKYAGVTEDTKAKTSTTATVSLLLQFNSLYCQHPGMPGVGFMAGLSHRGAVLDENLAQDAEIFLEGVQVAKPAAKPVTSEPSESQ